MIKIKNNTDKMLEKSFQALGTVNRIRIFDHRKEPVLYKAIARVLEIDDRMSAFKPDSDISKINRNAGQRFQKIHPDTYRVIRRAVEFCDMTDGAFDITIRPLVELWGINRKGSEIPSDFEIQKAVKLVNYKNIRFHKISSGVMLEHPGQAIDLGGIAKGFAADEVQRIFSENGIQNALIDLGGNIVTMGKRADGLLWQIGIQNPLAPTGQFLGSLSAENCTVVTSGSNEQFFIKDGIRYHHIINPQSGSPVRNSLLSATVVCHNSIEADALTTALFVLGPRQGIPLIEKMKAEVIFIFEDLSVMMSKGMKDRFKLNSGNEKQISS